MDYYPVVIGPGGIYAYDLPTKWIDVEEDEHPNIYWLTKDQLDSMIEICETSGQEKAKYYAQTCAALNPS